MILTHGTVLYASDDSDTSISEARNYVRAQGLTQDDVRLIRRGDSVMVVTKRDVKLNGGADSMTLTQPPEDAR